MEATRVRYGDNIAEGPLESTVINIASAQAGLMASQGSVIYDRDSKSSLTVEIPYQLVDSFIKNQVTMENNAYAYIPKFDGALLMIGNVAPSKDIVVEIYGSYAEDATFDFFTGTPILYCWSPEWFNTD